jgi:hypothetical protein
VILAEGSPRHGESCPLDFTVMFQYSRVACRCNERWWLQNPEYRTHPLPHHQTSETCAWEVCELKNKHVDTSALPYE